MRLSHIPAKILDELVELAQEREREESIKRIMTEEDIL